MRVGSAEATQGYLQRVVWGHEIHPSSRFLTGGSSNTPR
jgi:hypothetical protein